MATGIPKDRIYKWKQEGTSPKVEDIKKINAWISKKDVEKTTRTEFFDDDLEKKSEANDTFLNRYIDSLMEQKRILEVQNDFLRRNFELSLNSIAEGQHAAHSQLKALSWYQALVAAGGDEKKAEAEVVKMNNKAAWYGGISVQAGTAAGTGKKSKSLK